MHAQIPLSIVPKLDNQRHLHVYPLWAPVYDALFTHACGRPRGRAIEIPDLHPGERVLIPGIGTGLDLPHIPSDVPVVGADISPKMLDRAHLKTEGREATLVEMDAQALEFPDCSFDAALPNLILSVVPEATAFREAWRVLRSGGRAAVFDEFLPEDSTLTPGRRLLARATGARGTDPNRRLSKIIGEVPGVVVEREEPSFVRGRCRILLLRKGEGWQNSGSEQSNDMTDGDPLHRPKGQPTPSGTRESNPGTGIQC